MKWGVVRNREHIKLLDSYQEAEEYMKTCQDADLDFVHEGWITQEQADAAAAWQIQEVSPRKVAGGW
ncbi:MAG: hypothetical protein ABIG63_21615 [Chloroflexota bacterium]